MHRIHRYIAALSLTTALAAPVALLAKPVPQERVYDKEHKDYHHWDEKESGAWHRFLEENHRKEHEFAKADKKEQAEYWNWHHNHPD